MTVRERKSEKPKSPSWQEGKENGRTHIRSRSINILFKLVKKKKRNRNERDKSKFFATDFFPTHFLQLLSLFPIQANQKKRKQEKRVEYGRQWEKKSKESGTSLFSYSFTRTKKFRHLLRLICHYSSTSQLQII